MGSLPFGKNRWLLKHATGWCRVGRAKHKRGNQDHDECLCIRESESFRRLAECKGAGVDLTFSLAVKQLKISMTVLDTAPQWWKFADGLLPCFTDFDMWGTQHAVKEQDKLGSSYQFILGRFRRKWSAALQPYINSLQKKKTGQRWAISLFQICRSIYYGADWS